MWVGVGYSENPDTMSAGREAVEKAYIQACDLHGGGLELPCDFALLFSTSRHNAEVLRESVIETVGKEIPIAGGGAVGAISNNKFGYAGDQIIIALFWLDGAQCELYTQKGLSEGEENIGRRLGRQMAEGGVKPSSSVLLFYDAINHAESSAFLVMATPLLKGIEASLGFLPNLLGAGMQGDYIFSPTKQWTGRGISDDSVLALYFSDKVQVDSIILHGCRPATGYYTVTKSDGQTILEINGQPAIPFIFDLLKGEIPTERFPFNLTFGVNRGNRWDDFDEENYASRLCLGLDVERNGIVMFEPDMVEGTEFQMMYRTFFLDYIPSRIKSVFDSLNGRKPVFALFINCAGRAAGHAGIDLEDAVVVQKSVGSKTPLMGLYTGVEIGNVQGKPQGLDWTGVFCLFSVPAEKTDR